MNGLWDGLEAFLEVLPCFPVRCDKISEPFHRWDQLKILAPTVFLNPIFQTVPLLPEGNSLDHRKVKSVCACYHLHFCSILLVNTIKL